MDNLVVWADIPVTDLARAMKFYEAVLRRPFAVMPGGGDVAVPAPDQPPGDGPPEGQMPVAFDLAVMPGTRPSQDGCRIYLDGGADPAAMLQRAADAGGEILQPMQDMGEMVGWIGFFKDSEGNRIGVHRPPA